MNEAQIGWTLHFIDFWHSNLRQLLLLHTSFIKVDIYIHLHMAYKEFPNKVHDNHLEFFSKDQVL
jgi:hypothetical protein